MDLETILNVPEGELYFYYPSDMSSNRFDPRFRKLRVERRGLRKWTSFEENPAYLDQFKQLQTNYPLNWKPVVFPWNRYVGSETNMVDLLKLTLMLRLNIALNIIFPGVSIIGTPTYFHSYGNDDNRAEGGPEVLIAPDLLVFSDPNIASAPPALRELEAKIVTFSEAKVNHDTRPLKSKKYTLPGTVGCYESWLAQAVQCSLDLNVSLGWNYHSQSHTVVTRSSNIQHSSPAYLPSDRVEEPDHSSPPVRTEDDWVCYEMGDAEVPLLAGSIYEDTRHLSPIRRLDLDSRPPVRSLALMIAEGSPQRRKQVRRATPEVSHSSQETTSGPSTPCPQPPDDMSNEDFGRSPSPSSFTEDIRAEDPSHVFIKSYSLQDEDIGMRLFEFIILAKRAADLGVLGIGPWKLSHSALDALGA
ncbi:hypothetical protein F4825DRAFT_473866 [Nemania diffusa]|nr:hypothetical protein F4825DRAFT_473866 [Nemania diffusa]